MEENVERFCMAQERARRVLRHKPVRAWERSEWNTVSQNKTLSLSLSLSLSRLVPYDDPENASSIASTQRCYTR